MRLFHDISEGAPVLQLLPQFEKGAIVGQTDHGSLHFLPTCMIETDSQGSGHNCLYPRETVAFLSNFRTFTWISDPKGRPRWMTCFDWRYR